MYIPLELSEVKDFEQGIPTILVPFREQVEQKRGQQLKKFLNHIHRYHPDWKVIVIEQSNDDRKFNRGALLNIGAKLAETDHVIFHDVDLLPLIKISPYYTAIPKKPIHIGKIWSTKYDSPSFLGGILSISIEDIKKTNGYPNKFWGWGGEDDVLRDRLKSKKIDVYQPTLRNEGIKELEHIDTRTLKDLKNMQVWEDKSDEKKNPGRDGYKTVKYDIVDSKDLSNNIKKITVELK
jgi:hypothetical protein